MNGMGGAEKKRKWKRKRNWGGQVKEEPVRKGVGRSDRNLLIQNVVWSRAYIGEISRMLEKVFMRLVWPINRGRYVSYCTRAGKPV